MPRKQRRRPPPQFRSGRGKDRDRSGEQAAIDAAARRLVQVHDTRALQSLVNDLRLLYEEADRAANDLPSPEALSRYRRAARELAEAERALTLLEEAA